MRPGAARTALLGLVTVTATLNPWLGALLSVVVIVVAYLVAGWAFRLTVFGSVFCWDFLSGRRKSFFGDLHATGRDGVEFYTTKKVVTTRWF